MTVKLHAYYAAHAPIKGENVYRAMNIGGPVWNNGEARSEFFSTWAMLCHEWATAMVNVGKDFEQSTEENPEQQLDQFQALYERAGGKFENLWPQDVSEAEFMQKIGFTYIKKYAPEKLTDLAKRVIELEKQLADEQGAHLRDTEYLSETISKLESENSILQNQVAGLTTPQNSLLSELRNIKTT